jgi:hypothetical protein
VLLTGNYQLHHEVIFFFFFFFFFFFNIVHLTHRNLGRHLKIGIKVSSQALGNEKERELKGCQFPGLFVVF